MVDQIAGFFKEIYAKRQGYACIAYWGSGYGKGGMRHVWFHLPSQTEEMAAWCAERAGMDLYFSPFLYASQERTQEAALHSRVAFADLDTCDPINLRLEPTLMWGTSPGNRQAVWVVEGLLKPEDAAAFSKSVSDAHGHQGCDNGWIITKLLRVPGSTHNKTSTPHKIEVPMAGDFYTRVEFTQAYPPAALPSPVTAADLSAGTQELGRLPKHIREHLDGTRRAKEDRSKATWEMTLLCAQQGMSDGQILAVLQQYQPTADRMAANPRRNWNQLFANEIGKARNEHNHLGATCKQANCANTPGWMKPKAAEARDEEEFPALVMDDNGTIHMEATMEASKKEIRPVSASGPVRQLKAVKAEEQAARRGSESPAEAHKRRVRQISLPPELYTTPELESVQYAAGARAAHPDGVLGVMLARVSSLLSPTVMAVTGSGSPISLNFYSGVVSPPGGGKDRSIVAASALLPFPEGCEPVVWDVGTGEGLIDSYMESHSMDDDSGKSSETIWLQNHDRVCLFEPEAETLFTHMDRSGSSMAPLLLKMWGASQVGMGNAKGGGRTRSLLEGSYRYSMLIGFQPEKISSLLKRKGVGLPHRFVLFNGVPETRRGAGSEIKPMLERAEWLASLKDVEVTFPKEILDELEEINEQQLYNLSDPDADAMDSHAFVILAKLTALLCLLHGRVVPVMEDFLAAKAISEGTGVIREHAHALASSEAEDEAYEQGRKFRLVDDVREEGRKVRGGDLSLLDRAVNRIVTKVGKEGLVSVRDAKRALNSKVMNPIKAVGLAETAQDVLDEAVRRQCIVVDEKGVRLHT